MTDTGQKRPDGRLPPSSTEPADAISRWSRRKAEAAQTSAEPRPAPDDAPVLGDADMPPLESLDQDSDFSGFLSPGVSENLRRLALRKLFHSAKFNVTDGLDDYAEDYSRWEPLGDVVTSDMRHALEQARDRLMETRADSSDTPADTRAQADHQPDQDSPTDSNPPEKEDEPGIS